MEIKALLRVQFKIIEYTLPTERSEENHREAQDIKLCRLVSKHG